MRIFRKLLFWLGVVVCGLYWAWLLDRLISLGPFTPHSYTRTEYDVNKLCNLIKPGMEMPQVKDLILSVGKPNDIGYLKMEGEELERLKRSLRSLGKSTDHLLPSDDPDANKLPETFSYPHNLLAVGGLNGSCDIQMDAAGQKVLRVSNSGPAGIE